MSRKHKIYFFLHRWCGLIVGLFLIMMSITGAVIVFSDELTYKAVKPFLTVDNPSGKVQVDASFKIIQQQYPGWELRIYNWPQPNEALVYELRKKENRMRLFVHPVTGNIFHTTKDANNSLQRKIHLLHYTLLYGTTGKIIVFFTGIAFLLSLISGAFLYRRSIKKVLSFKSTIHWQTPKAFFSSLHRIIGVWSLLWNLLIVITGIALSYIVVTNALKPPTKKNLSTEKFQSITSIDRVLKCAHADYPDLTIHMIRIPVNSSVVVLRGRVSQNPSWAGEYANTLQYNGYTFACEKKQWFKDASFSDKWTSVIGPLHFGNYGGMALKIFYCIMGLLPGLLSVSGFIIWRYRKKKPLQFVRFVVR